MLRDSLSQIAGSFLLTNDGNFSHPRILHVLETMVSKQTKPKEIIQTSKKFFESIGFETVICAVFSSEQFDKCHVVNDLLSIRNITDNKSISIYFYESCGIAKFIGNCKTKLRIKFRYVNYWFDNNNKLVPIGTIHNQIETIKKCPHGCKSKPHVYLNAPSSDQQPWKHVACLECGSGSPTIEIWNKRGKEDD
jgi:hypothetical protein